MLYELCEEYKNMSSLYHGDIGHTKLLTMDIDTKNHSHIAQKPYTLPLNYAQWV